MAKMIVLKVTGDDRVFMVNLDSLTVEAVEGADLVDTGAKSIEFAASSDVRSPSASHALYGVETAVAADVRSPSASHALFGVETAVVADVRSASASHALFGVEGRA